MPFLEEDYWYCPFCNQPTIKVIIRPSTYKLHRAYGGKGGGKTIISRVKEEVVITSQQCENCGKSIKEIKKKWRERGII